MSRHVRPCVAGRFVSAAFAAVGLVGSLAWPRVAAAAAPPPPYGVTNLGTLPTDYNVASEAWDVNDYGQVIGSSFKQLASPAINDAFIWTPTAPNATTGTMARMTPTGGGGQQINSIGQVAGADDLGVQPNLAHLWTPNPLNSNTGTATPLPALPNRPLTFAWGINDAAQVVGWGANLSQATPMPDRAFLWKPATANGTSGTIVELGELAGGEDFSQAFSINAYGQVIGRSRGTNGDRGFLWQPSAPNATTGTLINLGVIPGHLFSEANGITDAGRIVGASYISAISKNGHAMMWTPTTENAANGSFTDLGDLPGGFDYSWAIDINESNTIVGYGYSADGQRATLWNGVAGAIDLNTLIDDPLDLWTLEFARGINEHGQIIGYGQFDPDGPAGPTAPAKRAFLLTPVPEPSLGAALLVPATLLLRRRRR